MGQDFDEVSWKDYHPSVHWSLRWLRHQLEAPCRVLTDGEFMYVVSTPLLTHYYNRQEQS